jgi:hypothetical protein
MLRILFSSWPYPTTALLEINATTTRKKKKKYLLISGRLQQKNKDFKKGFAPRIEIVHNPKAFSLSTEKSPDQGILIDRQGANV